MRMATLIAAVLALATSVWTWRPQTTAAVQAEVPDGKLLTQSGEKIDPEAIAYMEVVTWNKDKKAAERFVVARKAGKWIIPSHHDYPADSGTKIGDTCGGVLNVPRGTKVESSAQRHAEFGVLDPEAEGATDEEGRGKRIHLKDESGATLIDLVVGKKAEEGEVHYVRLANSDDVYTAKVNVNISTSFKDYVETDLLKVFQGDIRVVRIVDHSIDIDSKVFQQRAMTEFAKAKDAKEWTSPQTPEKLVVNESTLSSLLSEATGLRLVGVRPFSPEWLMARGIYRFQNEKQQMSIAGKEGSLELQAKDGITYNLYFGNIALGDEEDTSAAAAQAEKKGEGKEAPKNGEAEKKDEKKDETKAHNRYMAVFLSYNPAHDEDAKKKDEPKEGEGEEKKDKKDEKPEGLKKAETEQQRFLKFFYVISDESFQKMRPGQDKLFKKKELSKEELHGEKVPEDVSLEDKSGGLKFAELKKGDGDEAQTGDRVEVHYTGWTYDDGKQFDSSVGKDPFQFTLGEGQVIKGWDEGVVGMKVGGKRKLVIPSEMAYGETGSGENIPPNARLIFDVELLKIVEKAKKEPVQEGGGDAAPKEKKEGAAPEDKAGEAEAGEEKKPEGEPKSGAANEGPKIGKIEAGTPPVMPAEEGKKEE